MLLATAGCCCDLQKSEMSLPGNGIFVVQGEISTLTMAIKRGTRWNASSYQVSLCVWVREGVGIDEIKYIIRLAMHGLMRNATSQKT